MVREAQRAGLQFDETKLQALNCGHPEMLFPEPGQPCQQTPAQIPTIEIDPASPSPVADERDVSPFGQPADVEDAASEKHDLSSSSSTQPEYHTKFYKYVVLPLIYLLQRSLTLGL
jgi:hypothetical protein